MHLTLSHHPDGVTPAPGTAVTYDLTGDEAHFGQRAVAGPALVWRLESDEPPGGHLLTADVSLDPALGWLLRCDRIDFPPGGVAYRHTHPGPGIRCQLLGSLTVETAGSVHTYSPLGAWFETGPDPVYAVASDAEASAFVRVMVLPREWRGRRTISYVDPADADKPKLQRATVFHLQRRHTTR